MPKKTAADVADRRGSNSVQLRRYNERIILHELRKCGQASKADLARKADLTNAAVGTIIDELESFELIRVTGIHHGGGRGQPATRYELRSDGAYGIGVRLDRGSITTILMDLTGNVISKQSHDTVLPAPNEALELVTNDINEMLKVPISNDSNPRLVQDKLTGIGLAHPYNLSGWLRELDLPKERFLQWEEFDFQTMLNQQLRLPVFAENDGTSAAIAESFYGRETDLDSFLYLFIGAAIGGGVILSGDPLHGDTNNAGDVATIPVMPSKLNSIPAPKGNLEILITRASLNTLIRHLEFNKCDTNDGKLLEKIIKEGHPAVDEWVEDCVDALVPVIFTSTAILDAPLLVIDSDIDSGFQKKLISKLEDSLSANVPEGRPLPKIRQGTFGPEAHAVGAATLPLFIHFSPQTSILTSGKSRSISPQAAPY